MKLADLSSSTLERISQLLYDRILEKHEGPERWSSVLKYYETDFIDVQGHQVLLPVPGEQLPNITVLRCIEGAQGRTLTLFLKDRTHVTDRLDETFAGRIAICEKMPGETFFVALVYHEWYASAPYLLASD